MRPGNWQTVCRDVEQSLVDEGVKMPTTHLHGMDVRDSPDWQVVELQNYTVRMHWSEDLILLQNQLQPNLPWADIHFEERVSGEPLNPGESYKIWPHYQPSLDDKHREEGGKFHHTYMERFWPPKKKGIRYWWGDLNDVVEKLALDPYTRQAYLPIFFPEDTGADDNVRVPCTLGYHFMCRPWAGYINALHITYPIRSCDYVRFFRDDIYLAIRLAKWVLDRCREINGEFWQEVVPGEFVMHCFSLHCFEGDIRYGTIRAQR